MSVCAVIIRPLLTCSRKTIKSAENVAIVSKLIKEVKGLNSKFDAADIRGMLNDFSHPCITIVLALVFWVGRGYLHWNFLISARI